MKKFIILVVVILAFFTIDHPLIKEPRERLLGEGIGFLSDASKVNRSPAANMAKNRIKSDFIEIFKNNFFVQISSRCSEIHVL